MGLVTGTIAHAGFIPWFSMMLRDFGHLPPPLAAILALAIALVQGLAYGLWLWLFRCLRNRTKLPCYWLAPMAFLPAETMFMFLFPWFLAGTQTSLLPMIQICELGGAHLLGFLLVMMNGAWVDAMEAALSGRCRLALKHLSLGIAIPLLLTAYGLARIHMMERAIDSAPRFTVGIVQSNVGIRKTEPPQKIEDELLAQQRMSVELTGQGAELIVWPEGSYNSREVYAETAGRHDGQIYRLIPQDALRLLQDGAAPPEHSVDDQIRNTPGPIRSAPQRGFSTPLLFGAITFVENPAKRSRRHPGVDHFNSAILLDRQGRIIKVYSKVSLIPFGEYMPLGDQFPGLSRWASETGDMTPGTSTEVMAFGPCRLGVLICYEDTFPGAVRQLGNANILVSLSNDSWFGRSAGPATHASLSILRAVENRLALVRCTRTGFSCLVDPAGRIVAGAPPGTSATLLGKLPLMELKTPYRLFGNWPAVMCLVAVFALWFRRRKSAAAGTE